MRYAVYFTPDETAPLTRRAARWLGRDMFGAEVAQAPGPVDIDPTEARALTADARRYGFHATLKAPFHLAPGRTEDELVAALERFAQGAEPVAVPRMVIGNLEGFFAIVPEQRSAALDDLAANVVAAFEPFRAPLTQADIARRNPERLDPTERQNLDRWGYPYVFEAFRFHMTLTCRIAPDARARIGAALDAMFTPVLPRPFPVDRLALCVEPEPGAPFSVHTHMRLGRTARRKTA